MLYLVGKSTKTFDVLGEELGNYVRARRDGHSQACLVAALTNWFSFPVIRDLELRILATNEALIPVSWLKKVACGTYTNKAGVETSRRTTISTVNGKEITNVVVHIPKTNEIGRWSKYVLIDGEIAWCYSLKLKPDGSLDYEMTTKQDARDHDPRYQQIIHGVENEVEKEMKKDKSHGEFGSCHQFWHLKKERLMKKGIKWRSPAELNPNTNFD